jgi:capsular polysaccharide biosynthesis protein
MELDEAVQRIIRQHAKLLLALVVVGGVLGAALAASQSTTYTAQGRVVLDSADPQTQAAADAVADGARGIVTSPSHVQAALTAAHLQRDAVDVAAHEVDVQPLGSSNVLLLSVSDRDPQAAAALANALVKDLVNTRQQIALGQLRSTLGATDQQIASIEGQIGHTTSTEQIFNLRQQLISLESERDSLISSIASAQVPAIVGHAATPRNADPSHLVSDLVLGALIGLILGIGLAALIETFQPTIVGREAVAQAVGAPALGVARRGQVDALAARMRQSASGARVNLVSLVAVNEKTDLTKLAERLEGSGSSETSSEPPPLLVRPLDGDGEHDTVDGRARGFVVVAPAVLKRSALEPVRDLLAGTSEPVLGVITYPSRARDAARGAGT